MARPTKLTKDLTTRICVELKTGAFRRHAAAKFDIDEVTFSRWYHRGAGEDRGLHREFFLAVNAAEAEFAQLGIDAIKSVAAQSPKHYQWLLSRRFPDLFGRRDNVEEKSPEDKAQQQAATRSLVLERLERLFPEPVAAPEATEPTAGAQAAESPDAE